MNNTRYHRFRIERDAPTQEQYGSIVVGIPIGVDDFDKSSISTTEERTVRRCLSIPDGVPFTMLQHTIDPDRRDYEGKAATFSRPDGTLVGFKNQTRPSPTKCRPRTSEGAEPKGPRPIDYALMRQALIRLPETRFFH
jgi:hypothetical protein